MIPLNQRHNDESKIIETDLWNTNDCVLGGNSHLPNGNSNRQSSSKACPVAPEVPTTSDPRTTNSPANGTQRPQPS